MHQRPLAGGLAIVLSDAMYWAAQGEEPAWAKAHRVPMIVAQKP